MKKITVKTKLVGKDEVFKIIGVAHATGMPVLLVGPPGVGKTHALLEYAKAYYDHDNDRVHENSFILETDEGMRPAEVKGRVDVQKLVQQHVYDMQTPISNAEFVLINEIDKANAGLRNALLGIMNEKFIFTGVKKIHTPWRVFVATCNIIPEDEKDNPFWDRFVLKHNVRRVNKASIIEFFERKKMRTIDEFDLNIPSAEDIAKVNVSPDKLSKFIDLTYDKLSDRTLSKVPELVAAVSIVFKLSINKALVKTCELLTDTALAKKLAENLEPKEVAEIRSDIEMMSTLTDITQIEAYITSIEGKIKRCIQKGVLTSDDITSMEGELVEAMESNPAYQSRIKEQREALDKIRDAQKQEDTEHMASIDAMRADVSAPAAPVKPTAKKSAPAVVLSDDLFQI
jgi:MoxR-like ATPase